MTTFEILSLLLVAASVIAVPYINGLKNETKAVKQELTNAKKELTDFKLDVAKNYVTNNDMKEHVSTHLKSIEDQISNIQTMLAKRETA